MKSKSIFAGVASAIIAVGINSSAADKSDLHSHEGHSSGPTSSLTIPQSLRVEHEHLHQRLEALVNKTGTVGQSAKKLAAVLDPHFEKENAEALPLLGLLAPVGRGEISETMRPAIEASRTLKAAMPQMIAEHKAIKLALDDLRKAGESSKDNDATKFAEELSLHAQTEEDVLYPAAILVGAYIETQLRSSIPRK